MLAIAPLLLVAFPRALEVLANTLGTCRRPSCFKLTLSLHLVDSSTISCDSQIDRIEDCTLKMGYLGVHRPSPMWPEASVRFLVL